LTDSGKNPEKKSWNNPETICKKSQKNPGKNPEKIGGKNPEKSCKYPDRILKKFAAILEKSF